MRARLADATSTKSSARALLSRRRAATSGLDSPMRSAATAAHAGAAERSIRWANACSTTIQCRVACTKCPGCASPPARSTPSWATSTATWRASCGPSSGPRRPAPTWPLFPELAITGYPPEDLLLKPGFVADNLEALDKVAARTGRCAAVVGFVDAGRDLYNAAAVCASARCRACTTSGCCPNYAVFDEQRYFAPGAGELSLFRIAGVRVGVSICEDAWSPTGPIAEQAAGGAELVAQHQRLAVLRGPPGRARAHAGHPRRRRLVRPRLREPGRRPGRARLRRRLAGPRPQRRPVGARPQFTDPLLVVDLDVKPVFRKRLLDPRGRASGAALPEILVSTGSQAQDEHRVAEMAEPARPGGRGLRGARARHARLRAQERLHRRGHRPVGRHRLVAGRGRRRRRPRRRARARRVDAVAVLERGLEGRRRSWPTSSASTSAPSPSSPPTPPSSRCWRRRSTGWPRTSPRRTSSPHPGRDPHGPVEQVRVDGADHRQQERDGGRLLDALRRHGRRLRRHQGRAQDAGLRAVPRPQRAGGARSSPRRCSPSRRRPSCAPTSATTSRCRPTRCSTRSSRPTSRATSRPASWSRPASTPSSCAGWCASSTWPSTSAARRRPACG